MNIIYENDRCPIFVNVLYNDPIEAKNCKTGKIQIVQDDNTGLVYNNKFNPIDMDYNIDEYHHERNFSISDKNHLFEVKNIIQKYFSNLNILEIGCGSGFFLEYLNNNGFNVEGYDPSYTGANPRIKKEYYNKSDKNYDAIILRHVLEHIPNPYEFLLGLKENSKNNTLVYIEVPNLDYINENFGFYDFYYEHVNYFRFSDFNSMFKNIIEHGTLFGGEFLYIVADLNNITKPQNKEPFILNPNFQKRFDKYVDIIKNSKSKTVLWGCGLRGTMFSILMHDNNAKFDYFVDINPNKQNKYIPLISNENGYGKVSNFKDIENELSTGGGGYNIYFK